MAVKAEVPNCQTDAWSPAGGIKNMVGAFLWEWDIKLDMRFSACRA
jgi:hypothetical protein